ncbi:MAG: selenide, water dikinase SelD [Microthrixaceae bacterium]|nr:selenide, water dikinase SelD [Microthrixaceae bacterium]
MWDRVARPRLTGFSHGAGCGCKLSAAELAAALGAMTRPLPTGPSVLVGPEGADDAGVFRLDERRALVQTLDFFTPVVDDPGDWGAIAAANALSDVYAMGGTPVTALNIVAWPREGLDLTLLAEVLDGAAGVLDEAGCALVGGHSIDDPEPKFGLSVTGLVDPDAMLTNAGGRPGDVLVLTKPLGTGVVTTAAKQGSCPDGALDAAVRSMTLLNADASRLATAHGARCATDVTGFGLLGHLAEVVSASGVGAVVEAARLPLLPGASALAEQGTVPGGTRRNREGTAVSWGDGVDEARRWLACDAQTSGGLLVAIAPSRAPGLLDAPGIGRRAPPSHRVARRAPALPGRARPVTGPDPRRALPPVDALAARAPTPLPSPGALPGGSSTGPERPWPGGEAPDARARGPPRGGAGLSPHAPVLNATGVLLHTNLGRAPLDPPDEAHGWGPSDLEIDLATGRRGARQRGVEEAAAALTGADDALVVNNGAAALTLAVAALAGNREVVVSRGQLVEIGGSFRVPDVVAAGGAVLREVGTTNRTHESDYRDAVGAGTGALLEVHPSNFVVEGFVARVPTATLAAVAHDAGLPLVVDLGSGLLDERCPWLAGGAPAWLRGEPGARQALAAGADLVTFSGDKLLGGPQAGILCGGADAVARLAPPRLGAALRPGPGRAVAPALDAYLRGAAAEDVPFWRLALAPADSLRRAEAVAAALPSAADASVVAAPGAVGAGSLPGRGLPGWAVALGAGPPDDVGAALRRSGVLTVITGGRVLAHLRSVDPTDDDRLTRLLARAVIDRS